MDYTDRILHSVDEIRKLMSNSQWICVLEEFIELLQNRLDAAKEDKQYK